MDETPRSKRSFSSTWQATPGAVRVLLGIIGSGAVVWLFWQTVLLRLNWPDLSLVASYFWESIWSPETYKAVLMTGFRALLATCIGFGLALVLAVLTGRTV